MCSQHHGDDETSNAGRIALLFERLCCTASSAKPWRGAHGMRRWRNQKMACAIEKRSSKCVHSITAITKHQTPVESHCYFNDFMVQHQVAKPWRCTHGMRRWSNQKLANEIEKRYYECVIASRKLTKHATRGQSVVVFLVFVVRLVIISCTVLRSLVVRNSNPSKFFF